MPRKTIKGKVISTKMEKTVVVAVELSKRHPKYQKMVYETKKYKARDDFDSKEGDAVLIEECPPMSKTVTWKVIKNLAKEDK